MVAWLAVGCAAAALLTAVLTLTVACPLHQGRRLVWAGMFLAAPGVGWYATTDAITSGLLVLVILTQSGILWRSRNAHLPYRQ